MKPTVSIVIPCYNQEKYLAETIDSVLSQTFQDWEAIIVNDGSTDNSGEIAKSYVVRDQRIRYIYQGNGGVSKARNTGIHNSKGRYILPLDGDDIILPNYIEKAVTYLDKHSECKVFYCRAQMFGDSTEPSPAIFLSYDMLLLYNSIFNCFLLRREDALRIGGYDESFTKGYEDWEFVIRLLSNGGEVYQDDDTMFLYRQHNSEQLSRTVYANMHEDELLCQIYLKDYEIYNRFFPHAIKALRELRVSIMNNSDLSRKIEDLSKELEISHAKITSLHGVNDILHAENSRLQADIHTMANKEQIYMSYTLFKLIFKFFRFYRKHIKKEHIY